MSLPVSLVCDPPVNLCAARSETERLGCGLCGVRLPSRRGACAAAFPFGFRALFLFACSSASLFHYYIFRVCVGIPTPHPKLRKIWPKKQNAKSLCNIFIYIGVIAVCT